MIQPLARNTTSTTIPAPGSAVHIVHIRISRARTPGARSACSKSTVAATISERNARWVNRKPVHTVAVAPNMTAENEQYRDSDTAVDVQRNHHDGCDRPTASAGSRTGAW